jgi:hypothetical protein
MECVHLMEQPKLHTQACMHLYSEFLEQVILKLYLARVQIVVQEYLKWPRYRCVNVLERNGNPPLQISLLEVYLPRGVLGLWLATFLRVARGVDLARLSPRAKRAKSDWQATVTLGCPRWYRLDRTHVPNLHIIMRRRLLGQMMMAVTLRQLVASTSSILIWGSVWGFPSIIEISVRKF